MYHIIYHIHVILYFKQQHVWRYQKHFRKNLNECDCISYCRNIYNNLKIIRIRIHKEFKIKLDQKKKKIRLLKNTEFNVAIVNALTFHYDSDK